MKLKRRVAIFLILFIMCSSAYLFADTAKAPKPLSFNKMLGKLTRSHSTSLQKFDILENYKGKLVMGSGVVKDVLRSYGSDEGAMVYLEKAFSGQKYEVVLMVSRDNAEKIIKGKTVSFKGEFDGMSFATLRFKNARILKKPWWLPF